MLGYAEARGDLARGRTVTSLRTGDIAEWSEGGFVRLIGRTKRFVKLYGLRLGLDRIEAMIEAAGLEGRAVAPADRLVVLTSAADQTEAIGRLVAEECGLPRQDVTVHAIPAYPLLPSGKIDYAALTRLAQDLPFAAPPARTNPQSLGAEFAAATRRRTVRPEDTFAGLGGDSLAHLHLTLAIEDRLGHVPADWDRMTIAALDRLARDRDTSATPQKLQPIDPAVLARLIAMTCVVLFHLNQWPIMGGTWLLVLLTGYSLARFQRDTMVRGEAMAVLCNLLVPLLPCYYLLIVGYSLLRRDVPVEMFLLLANGPHAASGTALIAPYWFISLYAQIALAAAGLSLLPLARRAIRRDPFVAGLVVSLITTGIVGALRAIVHNCTGDACEDVIRAYPMTERSLLFCLPFLGLGWAIQSARDNWQRIQVIIALILAIIVFPIHTNGFLTIVAVGAGLLLLPVTISIPARLVRTSRRLATATLFVYLGHTAVIWLFKTATNLHAILGPVVAGILVLSISFALGLAIEIAYRRGEALVLGVTARRKTARHPLY